MRRFLRRRASLLAVAASGAVFALPQAALAAPPGMCDPTMPTREVTRGMAATGYTVVQGQAPEEFDATVLGVLPNGVGPGRDMIIVRTDSPSIRAARGIWFGMSGSPVYERTATGPGRLIGVIAFGLSGGPSPIAGLTPAQDLVGVLGYTPAPPTARAMTAVPKRVALPRAMARTIARSTGGDADRIASSLVQLKVPFSVSGLTARGMRRVSRFVNDRDLALIPYAGSSVGVRSHAPPGQALAPGDNFAAVLSYGDITAAGVGTTSYVCGDRVLAFGHPFFFRGPTTAGASVADAITIVDDPTFGPYKLAAIGGGLGRVDQDRLAAIRALLGSSPLTAPIRSSVRALDTGRARDGATDVAFQDLVPFLSFLHLFSNIDTTYDAIGPGSSTLEWTVRGTRQDGRAWSFSRSDLYASRFDISIESAIEMWNELELVARNPFEKVRFTGVSVGATVEPAVKGYTIEKVRVCQGERCRVRQGIKAFPGQTLRLQVVLAPFDPAAESRTVDLSVTIPRNARFGGAVEIVGASMGPPVCLPGTGGGAPAPGMDGAPPGGGEGGCEAGVARSFEDLIHLLRNQRRNDVLVAKLRTGMLGRVRDRDKEALGQVVRGFASVFVELPGGGPGGPEGEGGGGGAKPPPGAAG